MMKKNILLFMAAVGFVATNAVAGDIFRDRGICRSQKPQVIKDGLKTKFYGYSLEEYLCKAGDFYNGVDHNQSNLPEGFEDVIVAEYNEKYKIIDNVSDGYRIQGKLGDFRHFPRDNKRNHFRACIQHNEAVFCRDCFEMPNKKLVSVILTGTQDPAKLSEFMKLMKDDISNTQ